MLKRKENNKLPSHIECYQYKRDYLLRKMPEEDRYDIEEFFKKHYINYRGLTPYQQNIIFKRTLNYIYIVGYFFDHKDRAEFKAAFGPDKGFGVIRTQAFLFHKSGELLYELDHHVQDFKYQDQKKLLKVNEFMHTKLDNPTLKRIGECGQNFVSFDRAVHELLKGDNTCKSVDFIKGGL